MGPAAHSVSANPGDSVGVRQSTALLGGPQPERAFVSLGTVAHDPEDHPVRRRGLRGDRPARACRSSGSQRGIPLHSQRSAGGEQFLAAGGSAVRPMLWPSLLMAAYPEALY